MSAYLAIGLILDMSNQLLNVLTSIKRKTELKLARWIILFV